MGQFQLHTLLIIFPVSPPRESEGEVHKAEWVEAQKGSLKEAKDSYGYEGGSGHCLVGMLRLPWDGHWVVN